jgi:hypothetical protein
VGVAGGSNRVITGDAAGDLSLTAVGRVHLSPGGLDNMKVSFDTSGGSTWTVRPTLPPPDIVKLGLQAAQVIGSSALSTVLWTQQLIATNSSLHSTTTNPGRVTPQSTGVYMALAQLYTPAGAGGSSVFQVTILDSSGGSVAAFQRHTNSTNQVTLLAQGAKRFDVLGGFLTVEVAAFGVSTSELGALGTNLFHVWKL